MNGATRNRMSAVGKALFWLVTLSLGVVLMFSGIDKISFPYAFLFAVYNYEILDARSGLFLSMLLPWIELVVAVCLIGRLHLKSALLLSCIIGLVFVAAQSSAMLRGLSIPCGCFSNSGEETVGYFTFFRSAAIFVISAVLFSFEVWYNSRVAG
jgi:putative oxidoreductase